MEGAAQLDVDTLARELMDKHVQCVNAEGETKQRLLSMMHTQCSELCAIYARKLARHYASVQCIIEKQYAVEARASNIRTFQLPLIAYLAGDEREEARLRASVHRVYGYYVRPPACLPTWLRADKADCGIVAVDTELIDAFESHGYTTAFDVVGNGGLSEAKLKEVGLTKMCVATWHVKLGA